MSLLPERDRSIASANQAIASPNETAAVEAEAESKLRQSCYAEVRSVSCEFHEGVLTLRGRVSSYYLKQTVQTLALRIKAVREVSNQVQVAPPPSAR